MAVTESETGFSIGSENYETESTATSSETSLEDVKDKPGTAQEKLERLKAEAEEQMDETTCFEPFSRLAGGLNSFPAVLSIQRYPTLPFHFNRFCVKML